MKRRQIIAVITTATVALILTLALNLIYTIAPTTAQGRTQLTVSAAISLSNALEELKTIYQRRQPNVNITYNFGSSGALQQQIEQGAPTDVFFSAATRQMDALQQKNLIIPQTRKNLLNNRLVLVTPRNSTSLTSFRQLTQPSVRRLSIGEPRSVPAGQYAQELLTNLDIYQQLQPKIVFGNNVRQVLTFVETGNVAAGIVYTTDAKESDQVRVAATAPANLHSPIVYPIAVLRRTRQEAAARDFVNFLSSSQARTVFQKYGFGIAS